MQGNDSPSESWLVRNPGIVLPLDAQFHNPYRSLMFTTLLLFRYQWPSCQIDHLTSGLNPEQTVCFYRQNYSKSATLKSSNLPLCSKTSELLAPFVACIMEAVLEDWYAQGTSSKLFAVAAVVELSQDHGFFFSFWPPIKREKTVGCDKEKAQSWIKTCKVCSIFLRPRRNSKFLKSLPSWCPKFRK